MLNDESCVPFFSMTRAARGQEIAYDSRKQKLHHLNWPLDQSDRKHKKSK